MEPSPFFYCYVKFLTIEIKPSMAFLALLGSFLMLDMAINAETVHRIVTLFAGVAFGAFFLAVRIAFLVVAFLAGEPFLLVNLVGHLDYADLALVFLSLGFFFASGFGYLRYGDNVSRRIAACPRIKLAGSDNESNNNCDDYRHAFF
jgi:hypothetical protein